MRRNALAVFFAGCAAFGFAWGIALSAFAQDAGSEPGMVDARLIASVDRVVPGQAFEVGLHQTITPNWHTYWKNPGDSGEPTHIEWQMPEGFTASEIAWPIPVAIPVGPLTNYGYSDQVLLPVEITPPAHIEASEVTLTAKASWLVCEEICIPEAATLSITFPVDRSGLTAGAGRHAPAFDVARRSLPIPIPWQVSASLGEDLELRIGATDLEPRRIESVRFFPDAWGLIEHAAPQRVDWHADGITLTLARGELAQGDRAQAVDGVLVLTERLADRVVRSGFRVSARTEGKETAAIGAASGAARPGLVPSGDHSLTIWQAILFAVLGGLILNAMPCVLPILSLKVMSLAQHSGQNALRGGLAYLVGVLFSFAAIAGLVVALRAMGTGVGWGFQFQSPAFVLFMIALFFALGLSMSGVFHIGGRLVGVGESLTRRPGHAGSFFTGMLATVAATPCTAPFMGAAVGYAMSRSNAETFAVLLALGLGFAAPVVGISTTGAARRLLPKPGPWMETLKQILAFPLYATVAWLTWVLSIQSGSDGVLAAGIVLTGVALAAWIIGRPSSSAPVRFGFVAAIATAVVLVLPALNTSPAPAARTEREAAAVDMTGAEPFSEAAVDRHRRNGRPVFVNLTAAWCISCKVNEQVALSTEGFKDALSRYDVAYLKGDWTNRNEEIARVLRAFGRSGVPLYLLYPADLSQEPEVLPQILTEAIVVRRIASLETASGIDQKESAK